MNSHPCPLCQSSTRAYYRDRFREFLYCRNCHLVFVPTSDHLSEQDEKVRYDLHQNSPSDAGYRKFLSRLLEPLTAAVPAGSHGLDFGSGPGPTLSVMFEELGYTMALYDPFFMPDESVLDAQYDFVTATEVVEHFRQPSESLSRIWSCLKPGGFLGIMTKMVLGPDEFSLWHYKNDRTHICFYSRKTFEWLSRRWCSTPVFVGNDVILFQRTRQLETESELCFVH